MVLRQKTILVDSEKIKLWELKNPRESFSAWVRECVALDVTPSEEVPANSYTLDDVPSLPSETVATNPMEMTDRDEAEARARQILEGFGQTDKKLEENLAKIMERWDAKHDTS